MKILIIILSLITVVFSNPFTEEKEAISISHINDINIMGETSGSNTGDDMLTGTLNLEYRNDTSLYEIILSSYTQRHLIDGERVDTLTLGYMREVLSVDTEEFRYHVMLGGQIIGSGNFGGEFLQDGIHSLTSNPEYNLQYTSESHKTLGLQGKFLGFYPYSDLYALYGGIDAAFNIDGSSQSRVRLGIVGDYENISVWASAEMQYIEPLEHSIIEYSTPDNLMHYVLIGVSVEMFEHYELLLETTVGGAPLGEQDDFSTRFQIKYFLES